MHKLFNGMAVLCQWSEVLNENNWSLVIHKCMHDRIPRTNPKAFVQILESSSPSLFRNRQKFLERRFLEALWICFVVNAEVSSGSCQCSNKRNCAFGFRFYWLSIDWEKSNISWVTLSKSKLRSWKSPFLDFIELSYLRRSLLSAVGEFSKLSSLF